MTEYIVFFYISLTGCDNSIFVIIKYTIALYTAAYTYNPGQNVWKKMEKSSKTEQKFDIYFCVFFDCYCQGLISGRETEHWVMFPPKFEIFQIFPYSLRFYVLTREATRIPSLRYQISCFVLLVFNLSALRYFKGPKYYDQDFLKIFFLLSALLMIIKISRKYFHFLRKS